MEIASHKFDVPKARSFTSQVAHEAGTYLWFLLCYADDSL